MSGMLNLTLVQMNTAWHAPAANRRRIEHMLDDRDPNLPTDLVALPEMFSTGFTMDATAQAETMDGDSVHWMRELASSMNAVITGTLVIREKNRCYNRLIWMPPDGVAACYDKRHLFRMAGEDKEYSAGSTRPVFTIKGWRVRPIICYDLRFPVWCRVRDNNYDVLLCLANWPGPRHSAWVTLLLARAIENQAYVAAVNRVGTDGFDKNYLGSSMLIDHRGSIIADSGDQAGIVSACLDLDELHSFRDKFPVYLDADEFSLG